MRIYANINSSRLVRNLQYIDRFSKSMLIEKAKFDQRTTHVITKLEIQ